MALVLYRPLFWISLVTLALALFWLARRLRLRWLPAWVLRVSLIAIILFLLFSPRGEFFGEQLEPRQVLLIDRSDSVSPDARAQIEQQAKIWQQAGPNRLIVLFGGEIKEVSLPGMDWPEVDGRRTDASAALQRAIELLGDQPGRIVLATDSVFPAPSEVNALISQIVDRGSKLDVIPLPAVGAGADLFVGPLWIPEVLWADTPFTAILPVVAPVSGEATVTLTVNGSEQSERAETLTAGENYVVFNDLSAEAGILTLEADVMFSGDSREDNNQSYAAARIIPAPRVLFVSQNAEQDAAFVNTLRESGLQVDSSIPGTLPTDVYSLGRYQVIFLNNLLASHFVPEQVLALEFFASQMGGGLIFLGGRNSYTLGGYQDTLFAEMLPVELKPPPRSERSPTTFVLVVDRSESMGEPQPFTRPIELAREAAMRAIETLNADDYVGVLTYANDAHWDVPIELVGNGLALRASQDAISRVSATGITNMYEALLSVVQEVSAAQLTETRLILVLSDGVSTDGSFEEFQALARNAHEAGVSISTIALGAVPEAMELMEMIAGEADGRYHLVLQPTELPRIMIAEGQAARGENIQMGTTSLINGEQAHPVLSGFSMAQLPALDGYIALTSRSDQGAEDILLSAGLRDPILSSWQYGLGRVIAWMGDTGNDWASGWNSWPEASLFWSQVVRYALLNPQLGPSTADVQVDGNRVSIRLQLQSEAGASLNGLEPQLIYVNSAGVADGSALQQVGPGEYLTEIGYLEPGAYRAVARYQIGQETLEEPIPFAVNYPPEWQPVEPQAGRQALLALAEAAGGSEVQLDIDLAEPVIAQTREQLDDLSGRLLLALVLFWPLEVAIRRRWLPWI
jgi:Ca-activated chloride channel homolog